MAPRALLVAAGLLPLLAAASPSLRQNGSRRLDDLEDDAVLKAGQLTIRTPRDMIRALSRITGGNSYQKKLYCDSASRNVAVADGLFGSVGFNGPNLDGRGVDFANPVPPTTAVAMVFWSPGSTFPEIIDGCCGVEGGALCACFILNFVGIPTKDKTFESQRYLVVEGKEVNETAKPVTGGGVFAKKEPINTISPTWANLGKFMPSTFDDVFTKSGVDWKSKCASGVISPDVVATLERFVLGCGASCEEGNKGTEGTIFQFIEDFPTITSSFNISCKVQDDCGSCTDQHEGEPSAQDFFDAIPGGNGLCEDAATVRAYMYYYFDANAFFCGSGRDPGGPEDVTIPNLLISEAGGDSAQRPLFEGSFTCPV